MFNVWKIIYFLATTVVAVATVVILVEANPPKEQAR
jgi:hypothetical protein